MVKKRKLIWPYNPKHQLREAYNYIKKDSLKNADKVRQAIVSATLDLPDHPNKHAADKYKMNNDGTFRAFELYHYRITYQVTVSEIVIVRVRHTGMEPFTY